MEDVHCRARAYQSDEARLRRCDQARMYRSRHRQLVDALTGENARLASENLALRARLASLSAELTRLKSATVEWPAARMDVLFDTDTLLGGGYRRLV